jgi:predicted phosphate transport protein (TIGR00153 family)
LGRLTKLFTRGREPYDLFEEAGANLVRGAGLLEEMLRTWPERADLAAQIVECEHEGDRITLAVVQRANTGSAGRLAREDAVALASRLDDVLDLVEEVSDFLGLYRIEAPMAQAQELATVLHDAARQIHEALPRLRDRGELDRVVAEIHRLENEGDRIVREALASLFEEGVDPMVVIRWKDIFERLEEAIDATEHVANTLSSIAMKKG